MVKLLLCSVAALCLAVAEPVNASDRLELLKKQFAGSECLFFKFLSIVESDVFDRVDTAAASATLAADGRYLLNIGEDQYLSDLEHLYTYSAENNQVTVEETTTDSPDELSFIKRLDDFYESYPLRPDSLYRLTKRDAKGDNIPDSLLLSLKVGSLMLDRLEYFDVNDEKTLIVFIEQTTTESCQEGLFQPHFSDTVEVIRLFKQ